MKNRIVFNLTLIVLFGLILSCSSESKSLSTSPNKLDFGNVNLGDYAELSLELKNKYGKDILISNLDIS
ncbi:MAG: hypothetical protein K8S87_07510, partial [Planctomycetes bacterium]|nr:hypothetical protein [Planctomycetota bacterium]